MNILNKLIRNPKQVFLIDALGALLTTVSLAFILAPLEEHFGMPSHILYILSAMALGFFVYSLSCHKLIKSNWKPFLRIVMTLNTIYSIISIALVHNNLDALTTLGLTYFVLELVVIACVIVMEWKAYSHQSSEL